MLDIESYPPGGGNEMPFTQEGYRLAGIVPPRPGIKAEAFIILEKEEGTAAAAMRQKGF